MVVLALLVIFVIAYFIFRILKNMKQPHYDGSFKRLLRPHTESTIPSKIQPGKKNENHSHFVEALSYTLQKLDVYA